MQRCFSCFAVVILVLSVLSSSVLANTTERVSVSSAAEQANGASFYPTLSADGRYVAFHSSASNLVPGDTNGKDDVFVRDRVAGTTERVSVSSAGAQGEYESQYPVISADGRYVAFQSWASVFVPGDTNGKQDVFIRDRVNGSTERVSVSSAGVQGDGHSSYPSMSPDGRYVAFYSSSSNLVPGNSNGVGGIFVRDRVAGTTERVSVSSTGEDGNNYCANYCSISADGRYVAFGSTASNLVSGDTNGVCDLFVRDRVAGTTELVSVSSAGTQGNGNSAYYGCSISADGRCVEYQSDANNLVPGDTNNNRDIFVRDRVAGTTERVSVSSTGGQGNGSSGYASIRGDGRFVPFSSSASNLVSGDTNGKYDVFIRDRMAGTTERVSLSTSEEQGNDYSGEPSISADGRYVAFHSSASNLVTGDTNGAYDVFVRNLAACAFTPSFAPDAGSYTAPQDVVVTCLTSGATIHYTTTGVVPAESDPQVASGSTVRVDHTLTLKAKAWASGWEPSDVMSASYTITPFATTGGFVKFCKWNLISVPADPTPADPVTVFSGIDVPNASLQFWKNGVEGGGYQLYGDAWYWAGPIVRGTPYWFIETGAGANKDLSFYGLAPTADFEFTFSGHTTAPFWIMLGTPFPNPVLADNIRFKNVTKRGDTWLSWVDAYSESNSALRIVESNAQGWSATAQGFVGVTSTAWMGVHQFDPWYGYWLMIHDPGELKIKFPKP